MVAVVEKVPSDLLNMVLCIREGNGVVCLDLYPWRGLVYWIRLNFGGKTSVGSSSEIETSSLFVYLFPRNEVDLFAFV